MVSQLESLQQYSTFAWYHLFSIFYSMKFGIFFLNLTFGTPGSYCTGLTEQK